MENNNSKIKEYVTEILGITGYFGNENIEYDVTEVIEKLVDDCISEKKNIAKADQEKIEIYNNAKAVTNIEDISLLISELDIADIAIDLQYKIIEMNKKNYSLATVIKRDTGMPGTVLVKLDENNKVIGTLDLETLVVLGHKLFEFTIFSK